MQRIPLRRSLGSPADHIRRSGLLIARALVLIATAIAVPGQNQPAQAQPPGDAPPTVGVSRTAPPIQAPLADTLPQLLEQSAWALDVPADAKGSARGPYPVGNGRVYGVLGLGARANTIQALSGPNYATDPGAAAGHFGAIGLSLEVDGEPLVFERARARRVRSAGIVVTEDLAAGGITLRTTTFATPDTDHIVRAIDVVNSGNAPIEAPLLVVDTDGESKVVDYTLRKTAETPYGPVGMVASLSGGEAMAGRYAARLPTLAPGGRWRGVLALVTHRGKQPPSGIVADWNVETAASDARGTLSWWRQRLASIPQFDTDHAKLRDLYTDWQVLLVGATPADVGVPCRMLGRRTIHLREATGPLLLQLRYRMWDDAKRYLELLAKFVAAEGRLPTEISIAEAARVAKTTPDLGKVDWKSVRVAPGDIPSLVILQHLWYWRITRDASIIERHWPLLEVCLKRQRRGIDNLLRFHGDESCFDDGLLRGAMAEAPGDHGLVANAPAWRRSAYSLASGTMFLLAMHALGDMLDGLDATRNPDKWADGTPTERPGARYVEHTFKIMSDIEKRFWLEDQKLFAPAISPVSGTPHPSPVAHANLMPLWIGWTFPTGEKSRDNLRSTLAQLWRDGTRIGSTPTVGHVTGDVQGMLVTALGERDAIFRMQALDSMLEMAEPAGTWADLYGPDGRPTEDSPRGSPWLGGQNLNAALFAVSGIRFIAVPNWDNTDVRLELRLPTGAKYVTMKNARKDGRELNIFVRETFEKMTKKELEENAKQQDPKKRRDPSIAHRRIRFRIELLTDNPKKGYYDAAINAATTMFVRYITKETPVAEVEFWEEDREPFLPQGESPPPVGRQRLAPNPDADMLVITARPQTAELLGRERVTLIDPGLPWQADEVRDLLLGEDGRRAHDTLYLDWGHDLPATTLRPKAFWQSAGWRNAITAFERAGGKVVRPRFAKTARLTGADGSTRTITADPDGALRFTAEPGTKLAVGFEQPEAGERVLRIGGSCGGTASWNGQKLSPRAGSVIAMPDTENELVRVQAGTNTLEFEVAGTGQAVLYARLTDTRGM